VARIVKCQEPVSPDRAAFYQIALSPDGEKWSGDTFIDPAHLNDPLRWKKPALIATGFHGDIGRLEFGDMLTLFRVIGTSSRHTFMLLTKEPDRLLSFLAGRRWRNLGDGYRVPIIPGEHFEDDETCLPNVTIGCSVMYQKGNYGADHMREPMEKLAAMGWRTHVWYEPAIGPVNWSGWEFLELLIVGGESNSGGEKARPFDFQWARDSRDWCRSSNTRLFMKQAGSHVIQDGEHRRKKDRKGADMNEWPHDIRIREAVPVA
jgi:protein gp37